MLQGIWTLRKKRLMKTGITQNHVNKILGSQPIPPLSTLAISGCEISIVPKGFESPEAAMEYRLKFGGEEVVIEKKVYLDTDFLTPLEEIERVVYATAQIMICAKSE